ncbi:colicin E5-related ribonuclease [Ochrobactrum sp. MYb379]|uniref:colicin E5-related ribonuclease n=1 Tax=Ochrobactrum sp. MYb379 TaxID=2745275 RepID=UPI003098274C
MTAVDEGMLPWEVFNGIFAGVGGPFAIQNRPTAKGPPITIEAKGIGNSNRLVIDPKISGQLAPRGWTVKDVFSAVVGLPVGSTFDNRTAAKTPDGLLRNDTATVYGSKAGYIVVNDRTGEIVQVSGKNDPNWIPDSRIKWN